MDGDTIALAQWASEPHAMSRPQRIARSSSRATEPPPSQVQGAADEGLAILQTPRSNEVVIMEPGEVKSSPTAPHPAETLKRPLSPECADMNDSTASQDAKRMKDTHTITCLHCGDPAHRWTGCVNRCMHCDQRHLGGRCMALPIDDYVPGGFTINKHHRAAGHGFPAHKLTAMAVGTAQSISDFKRESSPVQPAPSPFVGVGGSAPNGPATRDASVEVAGTEQDNHGVTSADQASAAEKMSADRAALIALTSGTEFEPASPVEWEPSLGPLSSGANEMPLGQKGKTAGSRTSVPSNAMAPNLTGSTQSSTLFSLRDAAGRARPAAPPPASAPSGLAGTSPRNSVAAWSRSTISHRTATPNVPPYGQTLFGTGGGSAGIGVQRQQATASPPAGSARPAVAGPAATTAQLQSQIPQIIPSKVTPHDRQVWASLEQHIRDAVNCTARSGKEFNGLCARERVSKNVNQAIDILKPIILGTKTHPSKLNFETGNKVASLAATPVPMAGMMPDNQPAAPYFKQMSFSIPGMMQAPPQPPQVSMVWDWASGTWQMKMQ